MSKFNLNRFLLSRMVAALGDQFMMFAVPLFILKSTGSVKWSGLAFAIEWLPRLLFLPISGSLADRINIRSLYRFSDLGRTLLVLMSFFTILKFPLSGFWVLSLTMALMSILNSLAFIGMEATLPRQLSVDELPKAQSWLQGVDQVSQVMGPALAAGFAAILELKYVLGVGAIFFFISFLNSFSMPVPEFISPEKKSMGAIIRESYSRGFSILLQNRMLLQLCALTWIVNLIYGTALIVAPAIVTQTFGLAEQRYGLLQTAAGLFCILSFMVAPRLVKKIGLPAVGFFAFAAMAWGAVLAANSSGYLMFGIGLGVLLGSDGLFNVYIRSLRARIIPKQDFGKATGVIILVNNFSLPLSGFLVSIIPAHTSPQSTLLHMTVIAIVLGLFTIVLGKMLIGYKTLMPSLHA